MFQINPRLSGFTCLRTEIKLPVGDYYEGSPASARQGYPASLCATYRGSPVWPPTGLDKGMARYRDYLPYLTFPSLGEGATPLVPIPTLAHSVGLEHVWVKNEGQNPTGSHKDRMSPLVVARASATGRKTVAAASSGNAGVSLAAYAAVAGLNCAIVTVQTIGTAWKRALETYGVELIVTSDARERWELLRRKTRDGNWYPATNYMVPPVGSNPYGVQGFKTVAYEIVEELGPAVPDCVIVPTSRGDLLWGILEGFRDLHDQEQIGAIPRMYAVEPYPRIARVLEGSDYRLGFPGATRMSSIAGDTVSYQAVSAVKRSGGDAVVVTDDDVKAAIPRLAGHGFYCESSSAASLAALDVLHRSGRLGSMRTAVLILTSHGYKDTA
ncbi:MAG: pyridoxal-phosphate dependent enzyme [Paracoccaceae bacterium]|nr:pyridoxal-phosphate dependent enzyme [Paracoccaceae bacterium]